MNAAPIPADARRQWCLLNCSDWGSAGACEKYGFTRTGVLPKNKEVK